jgi:hypothetical protein
MGKKGTGRKAFLKGARPQEAEAQDAPSVNKSPATVPLQDDVSDIAEDPSEKFMKDSCLELSANTQQTPPKSADRTITTGTPSSLPEPEQSKNVEEESRGQLVQRHKRVSWKA